MKYKIIGIVLISWLLAVCSYNIAKAGEFGPLQGKIVDADTKEPIEGVVVFVQWRETHLWAGSTFIDVQETLTDKDGKFYLSGIWVLNPWKRIGVDTIMIIYKSGYRAISTGVIENWRDIKPDPNLEYVLKLEDGKPVIMLKKLTAEERKQESIPTTPNIPEDKMKLLTEEVNKEYEFKYPTRR